MMRNPSDKYTIIYNQKGKQGDNKSKKANLSAMFKMLTTMLSIIYEEKKSPTKNRAPTFSTEKAKTIMLSYEINIKKHTQ